MLLSSRELSRTIALAVILASLASVGVAAEWTSWRGPLRDGIATEKGLQQQWQEKGPNLLWRSEGLGKAYSSLSISSGKIVTMGQPPIIRTVLSRCGPM